MTRGRAGGAAAFGAPAATGGFGAPAATGGFGAPAAAGGFGAQAATPAFGAPATGAAPTGGFGGFGAAGAATAKPSTGFGAAPATTGGFGAFGASAATGAATGGFGAPAVAPAATGGFGAPAASTAAPAFGAPATGAASAGVFGAPAAAPALGTGLTGATSTGGFGAFGAAPAVGTAAAKPTSGFGAAPATTGGFGAFGAPAAAGAAAKGLGATGAAAGATAAAAVGPVVLSPQHHITDAMKYLVQPIRGMGNFMGSEVMDAKNAEAARTGKVKEMKESIDVYQAINVQLISWAPWDPAVMTQNAKMAKDNRFAAVQDVVRKLSTANAVERERELAKFKKEDADLVRLAMLPRFDASTINERDPNTKPPRELCDVVENQSDPCEWKPEVDNPHCRFRHYILQPLTQAQMRLPVEQRHGFSQSAASSPNDPLFQSKLQENPNPYKYCVLPIVGFQQLERRVKMQDDKMEEQNAVLQSFEREVIRMREFQSVEFPIMLAQRRAKQVELGRRTIEILRRLETKREPTSAPSRREEAERRGLNDGLDQLRQEVAQGGTLQRRLQQLEELMAEVRMQDRKRLKQRSVASPACDPLALERLDKFLEHRLKGIRHICDIVQKDYNDTQVMLHHLGPPM